MRIPLIAGNWKMYKDANESVEFVNTLKNIFRDVPEDKVEISICPPFTNLRDVWQVIKGTNIKLGAQNLYPKAEGAFTGEISPLMLRALGVHYVIVGHSERRNVFKEDDDLLSKKLKSAISHNLIPIFCVGEKIEERKSEQTFSVIERQLEEGLKLLTPTDIEKIIFAYEPVWAIGTGINATPEQAEEVHFWIKNFLEKKYLNTIPSNTGYLYGLQDALGYNPIILKNYKDFISDIFSGDKILNKEKLNLLNVKYIFTINEIENR